MSHNHEEDIIEEDEIPVAEGEPEEEETTIVRRPAEQQNIQSVARHPKIDKILQDPNVLEVHVRYRRSNRGVRQPYVCIVYVDGSTIERPLADLTFNERPMCTDSIVPQSIISNGSRVPVSIPTAIEPPRRRSSRWNFLRLKNRGGHQDMSDVSQIVAENDNVVIKRTTTLIRKGCGCGNYHYDDGYTRRRRRRYPTVQEVEQQYV